MNNKAIAYFMISGAIFGGTAVALATSHINSKLKRKLYIKGVELNVTKKWYEAAVHQMSVSQLFDMMKEVNTMNEFEDIIKDF